jgi:general secretion pathway protein J
VSAFHRQEGFTIAEMLVTRLIMGMIATMLVSGVAAGRRVWERTETGSVVAEQLAGAQALVRQRIEHLFPVTTFETLPPAIDFDGESSSITFVAPPRTLQAPSALRRYKFWLSPKGDLVLSSVSTVSANPKVADENLVLLSGVQALDFAYFGQFEYLSSSVPGWQLQWKNATHVPELVRVHVAFEPGDRRVWPDLLIRPRVTMDSQCVFNPATGTCRGRR